MQDYLCHNEKYKLQKVLDDGSRLVFYLYARVSSVSHRLQQPVKLWIESDGEGTVYYST